MTKGKKPAGAKIYTLGHVAPANPMPSMDEPVFCALACMGNATMVMSFANTWLEDVDRVPQALKREITAVNAEIHRLQDELRKYKASNLPTQGSDDACRTQESYEE